jgi:hypothetical protein
MWHRGLFILLGALLVGGPAGAVDPADKCEAGKLKEADKYCFCQLKAESKYVKADGATKYADALAKCESKSTRSGTHPSAPARSGIRGPTTAGAGEFAAWPESTCAG